MYSPYCEPKTPLGPRFRVVDRIYSADKRSGWLYVGGNDNCGRKTTVDIIHDLLQEKTPHPIQLVGCYGIGKTATVEYAILKENEKRVASETQYGIVVVSNESLEEAPVVDNENRFLANLFRDTGLSLNASPEMARREECGPSPTSADLLQILKDEAIRRRYERLVVVLDSFEHDSFWNPGFKQELQDFITVVTGLGWLLIIETRHHEEIYQIDYYDPSFNRAGSKKSWPGEPNPEEDATKSQWKIKQIPLRGLSRRHAWQLIWGASRETLWSFRKPYYLSRWKLWRLLWIPFLVQRYTGRHPMLLHTACYAIDDTLRELKLDRNVVVDAINDSFKFRYSMLNKLQKSINLSRQMLSSGNSEVRGKAHKNLEQQGLLIKNWPSRSHLPEILESFPEPPVTPPDQTRNPHILVLPQEIEKQYLSSTFSIWNNGSTAKIGTGFLVSHNGTIYGITCAHNIHKVFSDAAGEGLEFCVKLAIDNPDLKVKIIHYKPDRKKEPKHWPATQDIAILSVESDVLTGGFFPLVSPNTEHGKQGLNKFFGYFVPAGDWVDVSSSSRFQFVDSGMYKIYLENFKGSTLEGASGAPLLNFQSKEYLGIVRAQQEAETDLWAYLIPSTKIHNVLQEICSNE